MAKLSQVYRDWWLSYKTIDLEKDASSKPSVINHALDRIYWSKNIFLIEWVHIKHRVLKQIKGSHFTVEKPDIKEGHVTCPRSYSEWQTLNLTPGSLTLSLQGLLTRFQRSWLYPVFQEQDSVTSLVVQELRIHLQCRGKLVQSWLGNQDPTCCGATKPAHCNYMPQLENFLCYKRKYPHDSTKITCAAARPYATKNEKQTKQVFRKTDRWQDQHQARTRGEFSRSWGCCEIFLLD